MTGSSLTEVVEDPVASRSLARQRMEADWPMITALLGGTRAMRAAGEKFLPKFAGEDAAAYRARLHSSFLFPAYRDAIDKIVAKPFGKPIQVENAPEELDYLQDNADAKGNSLTQFGSDTFRGGLSYGIVVVIVDMPRNPNKEVNKRPYFSLYRAKDVIGGKGRRNEATGEIEVTQIRLQEWEVVESSDYREEQLSVIRVWNAPEMDLEAGAILQKGTIEIWKKRVDDAAHKLDDLYEHDFPGIPIAIFDPGEIDFLEAAPPLLDLAWLNIEHWQSRSDQRSILHYARAYQMLISGMTEDEQRKINGFGVNQVWFAKDPEASAQVIEHTGASIEAGERDIQSLEERMETLGAQALVQRSGNQTATAKAIDDGKSLSQAQHWVANLEQTLRLCYRHAATWLDAELDDQFNLEVFKDFGMTMRRKDDLDFLDKARGRGDLSRGTWLREVKKRGVLGDDVDVEAELLAIEDEMTRFSIAPERIDDRAEGGDPGDED